MSPAPPPAATRTAGQKRKADEAGMVDLSLDALSAAAAVAAAAIPAPIHPTSTQHPQAQSVTTILTSQTSNNPITDAAMAVAAANQVELSKYSQQYGGAPPVPPAGTAYFMDSNGDEGYGDDGGIIRCICGWDDDDGFTVQCDRCLVWQHCACFGMDQDSLPESYMCEQCQPRPVDVDFARNLQHRRKMEEARNKELEEQHELALAARRNQAPSLSVSTTPKVLPEALPPLLSAKESRGRKSSQSIDNSTSIEGDYFSTPAGASSAAVAAPTSKAAKRKSGNSGSKSSRKPSMTVTPAPIPETVPLQTIATPRDSRMRDDDDMLDPQERFEAWHIEYTPITANIYSDRHTQARLNSAAVSVQVGSRPADATGPNPLRLRAFEVGTGKVMAPLADPADEEEAATRDSMQLSPDPHLMAPSTDSGLSVVGSECVPIEIEAGSLAEVAQRATVRYIPEGVAAGMFAQIQGMTPDSFPNLAAASHYSRQQQAWGASPYVPRPIMHGLYADVAISAGTFICEYRGEIIDADAYRADPINQYAALGTTKPHVHILPPPLNLAIDARRYGTEARFARPSCHPNSVLRPILLRPPRDQELDRKGTLGPGTDIASASKEGSPSSSSRKELLFGIFAISDINRGHEITLGWEWDDLHIVHFLPELVKEPPRVSRRAVSPVKDTALEPISFPYAGTPVAAKMDAVTSSICSVTICACLGPASSNSSSLAAAAATYINPTQLTQSNLRKQDCALAQMVRVAHGMELLQVIPSAKSHRKLRPPDFSPLIGRRRWWRPLPLPLTPSDSTKAEEPRKTRARPGSAGDVDMEDASRNSGSDEDDDDERRSEASSLTEPLSDSMEAGLDEEMAEVSISASGKATSKSRGKQKRDPLDVGERDEDDDEDRPTILPLKKRVAGTRLKATYFDAELASDGSDGDHMDILSKSALKARKQAGRVRTVSRSTNIAKDARRRPIRSTLDSADEASDSERRKAKAAKKMAQKREAKIQAKIMRKPKKDTHQPSSPLSSLSSQASLSSLEESVDGSEDDDSGGSSEGSSDEDESGSESQDSDGSDSGSESDSTDSSGSDSDSTDQSDSETLDRAARRAGEPRPKKSNSLQKRARKRTAKFRADIAALGDADTSSDDSAIPAGQRKRSSKPDSEMARKNKAKDVRSGKKLKEKKKAKQVSEKKDKSLGKRKETSKLRAENARAQQRKEDRGEKRTSAPKERKVQRDRTGDVPEGAAVVRKTKPRLRPASPSSDSDSESGTEDEEDPDDNAPSVDIRRKASKMQLDSPDRSIEVRRSVIDASQPVTALPASTSGSSIMSVAVKSEDTSMTALPTDQVISQAEAANATPVAVAAPPEPPKPEPPRKKLSLADYKRRLAEQKVTEQVSTPAVPETPVSEAAPTPMSETPAPAPATAESGPREDGLQQPLPTPAPLQTGSSTVVAPSLPPASSESIERPVEPLGPPPASPERSRPRMLSRAFPPLSPSEDRRETELASALSNAPLSQHQQPPRYGGAIPTTEPKREHSPTRSDHFERRSNPSLGPAWSSTNVNERPRYGRVSDPSEPSQGLSSRLGAGFRPATTVSSSGFASAESPTRPELSIAGRASGAVGSARGPPSGSGSIGVSSSNMPNGPAGLQTFNPPRGPRALMGSSMMAPPNSAAPLTRDFPSSASGPNSTPVGPPSSVGSNTMPPPASLSSRLVPPSPGAAASGANKIGSSGGTGWSRVPIHSGSVPPLGGSLPSGGAPGAAFASSSTPSHFSERASISSASSSGATPASLRADLMNFDGVPKGPASMRGESSGSSSYEDYEYFGGRDRGRGGWRGPRVRKRGGGRGRGWGMRQ
ncbi:SET domain-containing protein 3 [Tilletia horrida]|nr:SET domain-containing protein 3 [Tilletia horrida]